MHAAQECFAAIGIAVAVALVFATIVAESSIAGSSAEVVRAVTGPATLQLRARGGQGFEEAMLGRVERLPGVKLAAPLLEQTATLRPGRTAHDDDLAGTDQPRGARRTRPNAPARGARARHDRHRRQAR